MMKKTLLAIALTAIGVTAAHAGTTIKGNDTSTTAYLTVTQDGLLQITATGSNLTQYAVSGADAYIAYVQNGTTETVLAENWGIDVGHTGNSGFTDQMAKTVKSCLDDTKTDCIVVKVGNEGDWIYDDSQTKRPGWLHYKGKVDLKQGETSGKLKMVLDHDLKSVKPGKYPMTFGAYRYVD